MDCENYLIFDNPGLFRKKVMYIDTTDFFADKIFAEKKLDVSFLQDYENSKHGNYVIIIASINKKDIHTFKTCMKELARNNLIFGNTDYVIDCEKIMKEVLNGNRKR